MWWSDCHVLLVSLAAVVTFVDGCSRSRRSPPRPPVNRSPSISCPNIGDVTAPVNRKSAFVKWGNPSVSDDHGGWRVSQKSGRASGSEFSEGSHTVVYQVVDRGGLSAVCSRTFRVKVIRCRIHSRPRNGQMNCNRMDNIYGTKCTFSCDFGYYLDGMSSSTCQSSRRNQHSTPTCKKKSCGPLETPPKSLSTICTDGTYYGSVCTLMCDSENGYTPRYLNLATCQGTSVWTYHNWECPDTEKPQILNCPDGELKTSNSSYVWTTIRAADNSGKVTLTQTRGQKPGSLLVESTQIIEFQAVDPSDNAAPPCIFALTFEDPSCAAPVSGGGDYDPVFNCPSTKLTVGTSCSTTCRHSRVEGAKYIRCERSDTVIPAAAWKGFGDPYPTCHKKACPDLKTPINGALVCDKFFGGETCQIQCHIDYDVPEHMKHVKTLVCGSSGGWKPIPQAPDCTSLKFPDATKLPSELYYYVGSCSDNGTNVEIREAFLQSLIDSAVHDCKDGKCLVENVEVSCGPVEDIDDGFGLDEDDDYYYYYDDDYETDEEAVEDEGVDGNVEETVETANHAENHALINRRRRQAVEAPDPTVVWTTGAPAVEKHHVPKGTEEGSGTVRRRRKPISRTGIKFNWVFRNTSSPMTEEKVTKFVDKALSSLRLSIQGKREARFVEGSRGNLTFHCGPGNVAANSSESLCVACPRGTFQKADICEACPVHTYSNTSGQTACTPCGPMTGTKNNGSKTDGECIEMCRPGHYSTTGLSPCTPCPLGTIQPEPFSTECTSCPMDSSTDAMGSSSLDQCLSFDLMVSGPVELRLGQVIHDWSEDLTLAFWLRTLPPSEKNPNVSFVFSHPTRGHQMTFDLSHQTNVIMRNRQVPVHTKVPQDLWTHMAVVWKGYPSFVDIYRAGSRVTHYGDHTPLCFVPKDTELTILIGEGTGVTLRELFVLPLSNSSDIIARLSKSCSPEAVGFESLMTKVVSSDPSKISMVVPSVCSEIDRCEPDPCNGHSCRSFKYGPECTCMGDYSGPTCEIPPDYCIVANKCQNDAQCQPIEEGVNCTCSEDYKGRYCETPIVHGNWSDWSSWSTCSVTCDGGERSRSRKCDEPAPEPRLGKPCGGSSVEKSVCNLNACPECKQSQLTVSKGVSVACTNVSEDKGFMNCSVSCDQGLVFAEEPPSYTCREELWVPGKKTVSCVDFEIPGKVTLDYTVPYKTRVGLNMTTDLDIIQNKVSDCASQTSCAQNETCQYAVTMETCHREAGGCSDIPEGYRATIKFTVDVVASNWSALISKNNLDEAWSTLNTTFNELEEIYDDCFWVVLPTGTVKPGTSVLDIDLTCPVGSVPDQGYCTTCAPGTVFDNSTCSQCERGWYQEDTGKFECDMCPAAYNTKYMGSSFKSECLAPPADAFMLLTDPITGHIWSVNMSDFTHKAVALPDNVRLGSSGYNPFTNHIFYADKSRPAIHSVGPTHSKTYITLNWAATVDGLAIDPLSGLIFYTDRGNDVIGVVTIATKHHKIVIQENTHMPRHIEVDPVNGVMYWIDWGKVNKIERANYDGSDRQVLVKSAWPEGLSLDREAGRLYWGDAGSKTVKVMDIDGSNLNTLLSTTHHLSAITVFQDYLFYSAIMPSSSSAMMRVNTDGSGEGETELPPFRYLSDIHAHRKSDYKLVNNGCSKNNGGCTFMCFPRPNGKRVCACPKDYIMDGNQIGCKKTVPKSWWDVWMQPPRRRRHARHMPRLHHED